MACESTGGEAITASSASTSCGGSVSARPASTTMFAPTPQDSRAGPAAQGNERACVGGYCSKLSFSSSAAICSSLVSLDSIGGSSSTISSSIISSAGAVTSPSASDSIATSGDSSTASSAGK